MDAIVSPSLRQIIKVLYKESDPAWTQGYTAITPTDCIMTNNLASCNMHGTQVCILVSDSFQALRYGFGGSLVIEFEAPLLFSTLTAVMLYKTF